MYICRVVFFHLYESPKYLVHAGRLQDAAFVLHEISKVNGNTLEVKIEDVHDLAIESAAADVRLLAFTKSCTFLHANRFSLVLALYMLP